jgi:hypothetical protein
LPGVQSHGTGGCLSQAAGDPACAVEFDESPEGHQLRFDSEGRLMGLTLVSVRADLEAGRKVTVMLPEPIEIVPGELRRVLQAA